MKIVIFVMLLGLLAFCWAFRSVKPPLPPENYRPSVAR